MGYMTARHLTIISHAIMSLQEGLKSFTLEQIDASESLQTTLLEEGGKKKLLDALRKELE